MEYKFETKQVRAGQEKPDPATGARAVPIYQTTSYVFDDCAQAKARFSLEETGNIYGRLTNDTQEALEARVTALEGGAASLAAASGAAAIYYALLTVAQAGDHIVAQKTIYGGTHNLLANTLPLYGVTTTFIDVHNLEEARKAIRPQTRALYLETLGNPNSDIPNLEALSRIAHENDLPVIVDNTFATPYLMRPIERGADIVVHSATKFLGGHGTSLGGVLVDAGTFPWKKSGKYKALCEPNPGYHGLTFADMPAPAATYARAILLRDTGAAISPFNAFIILQGIETLSLRVDRQVQNALKVVDFLAAHPLVAKVNHPSLKNHPNHDLYNEYFPNGAGSIFTFELKGNEEDTFRFIDSLELFSLLANVADMKSLVIHPASTTHSQLGSKELAAAGITPTTIRLSIGAEHVDDIIRDLEKGFAALGKNI